jgi:hypothetical protein
METLILNLLQYYLVTGVILSLVVDISIRVIKVSPPFSLKDIIVVALFWPTVISTLVQDYINGNF